MDFVAIRKIDNLGRLVLPVDYREHFRIGAGDLLELVPTENGILVRPLRRPVAERGILSDDFAAKRRK